MPTIDPNSMNVDSHEENKPRLVIKKMALINFKSYAGRQEIGPFHKSFSAVVGPNGSGKSNVIDSLLFVFGYRANKMRQGKLSELIHSSAKHPNLDQCTVEVHFQEIIDLPGPDAYELVPNSELVVSRSAYRNNSSKYFINGNPSTYTDVTSLLKSRGIDLDHKRFLILQGEVESISQMKPKATNEHEDGLLEYLEDIIGTSKYKESIKEAAQDLEKLNEERSEKLTRVKIVEKEKQGLESKRAEALDFVRSENELVLKKSTLYQANIMLCDRNIDAMTQTIEQIQQKLQEENKKHSSVKDDLAVLEQDYNTTVKEYEEIGQKTNEVLKELAKYDREDIELQENKKHLKSKLKKIAKEYQKDELKKAELETWFANHSEDLERGQSEIATLEENLTKEEATLEEITASLKGKTEKFSIKIEAKQKELAPWVEKINQKQSQIDVAQSEYQMLEARSTAGQRSLEEALVELKDTKNSIKEKKSELEELQQEKALNDKKVSSLTRKLESTQSKEQDLKTVVGKAREAAQEARNSLQAASSKGAVLSSLMRLKDLGRIKGIHGRLGNLGVIDDKYDVAISTACPSLDNIVVDTVQTGQNCIEFLRKNNLGRAVFVLLEQLPKMNLNPIKTPENVPRLFDLVKPKDAMFAPAFYSVLRDTLVAKDLDQANRIAFGKQRWRVVTLDGQLIDKSGTMSGGGNKVHRGAMSSKFVMDDVAEETVIALEKKSEVKVTEYRTFIENRKGLERELEEARSTLPALELKISKLEMDIEAMSNQFAEGKKKVVELKEQVMPDEKDIQRMEELEAEIAKYTKELDSLKSKASKFEEEIKSLQDQILSVGGVRLRSQNAKVESIKEQIEIINSTLVKSEVEKKKAEKDLVKIAKGLEKYEAEVNELKEELIQLNALIEEKSNAAMGIRARSDEAREIMEEKKAELEEMKKLLEERTAMFNESRVKEVKLRNQLEDSERSKAESTHKSKYWKAELDRLNLQEITNEDAEQIELQTYSPEELEDIDRDSLKEEIATLETKLQEAKPNLSVLNEYREREAEFRNRVLDLEQVTQKRDGAKQTYDNLRKSRLDEFMVGFNTISHKLKEMYQMITLGGNAELELVDSLDPFSEGIIFSVMPPKKSWKNISNLSGGEKTLSSLALVFALHHFKPTPLYVMDEIDAALDFRNVSIVANYIKDRTKNAQFVIISLRNNMFELADRLVGIYKTDNCTKSITINPEQMATALM